MPFDSLSYAPSTAPAPSAAALIDTAAAPCAEWAALNPERALALLFVAPQDCAAVDVLMAI